MRDARIVANFRAGGDWTSSIQAVMPSLHSFVSTTDAREEIQDRLRESVIRSDALHHPGAAFSNLLHSPAFNNVMASND